MFAAEHPERQHIGYLRSIQTESFSSKPKVIISRPVSFCSPHSFLFYAFKSSNAAASQNRLPFLQQNIPNDSILAIYDRFRSKDTALSLRWSFLGLWVSVRPISFCIMHLTHLTMLWLKTDRHFCSRTYRMTSSGLFMINSGQKLQLPSLRWSFLGPWVSVCLISFGFMH